MKWAYRRYSVEESRICPSGLVYRPEAKLRIGGAHGDAYIRALLDTGADHSVFPISIAKDVGAELFEDEHDAAKGISGHEISIIPGRVELELLGDDESYRWSAVIGFAEFVSPSDECSILGHVGCLEFFSATFDGVLHVVELTPRVSLSTC
jgi:hypothetical protein